VQATQMHRARFHGPIGVSISRSQPTYSSRSTAMTTPSRRPACSYSRKRTWSSDNPVALGPLAARCRRRIRVTVVQRPQHGNVGHHDNAPFSSAEIGHSMATCQCSRSASAGGSARIAHRTGVAGCVKAVRSSATFSYSSVGAT